MRTFGLMLAAVAGLSLALALGRDLMPFRLPLTGADAWHAALVLFIAAAVALIGSRA